MERWPERVRPRARSDRLAVKVLPDEVLVYDLIRHRAHALNRVAAAVWRQCDGTRTPTEIARATAAEGSPLVVEVVDYALAALDRAHLLEAPAGAGHRRPRASRRELLRQVGIAALLPVVASVAVPTAAAAASCLGEGAACEGLGPCCPGLACCLCEGQEPPAICQGPGEGCECLVQ